MEPRAATVFDLGKIVACYVFGLAIASLSFGLFESLQSVVIIFLVGGMLSLPLLGVALLIFWAFRDNIRRNLGRWCLATPMVALLLFALFIRVFLTAEPLNDARGWSALFFVGERGFLHGCIRDGVRRGARILRVDVGGGRVMDLNSTERVFATLESDPMQGRVVWAPVKSLWLIGMTLVGVVGGAMTVSWDALAVFGVLTAVTICAGHSVGMHRLLIHRSFRAPIWVEHTLVYLGTLVGMAGPFGMIKAHDMRDWMQRQPDCHDHAAHRQGPLKDYWWQTHCVLDMPHPPTFEIEPNVRNDRFYRFIEATWMAQQVPVALVLFVFGGWAWVIWGVCLRVAVSLTGHWLIGHLAHTRGPQTWVIDGLAVQGHDVAGAGLITFGEAWHNNHHAWPQSAKLGVLPGQTDPGWWFVSVLGWLGLAWDIKTPEHLEAREGLTEVGGKSVPLRFNRVRLRNT